MSKNVKSLNLKNTLLLKKNADQFTVGPFASVSTTEYCYCVLFLAYCNNYPFSFGHEISVRLHFCTCIQVITFYSQSYAEYLLCPLMVNQRGLKWLLVSVIY